MLLSDLKHTPVTRRRSLAVLLVAATVLSACQFQPLHGRSGGTEIGGSLANVTVGNVDSRVGQQVRNHLLFLLNGGNPPTETRYRADLRVTAVNETLASSQAVEDRTAGRVQVRVSYELIDLQTSKQVSSGSRQTFASYDRTTQSFANARAQRDAENRAAIEAAEIVRLAIAGDLKQ